jgi:hypothetical protein
MISCLLFCLCPTRNYNRLNWTFSWLSVFSRAGRPFLLFKFNVSFLWVVSRLNFFETYFEGIFLCEIYSSSSGAGWIKLCFFESLLKRELGNCYLEVRRVRWLRDTFFSYTFRWIRSWAVDPFEFALSMIWKGKWE